MIIRPDYVIYAVFAYITCVSDAVIYSPIGNYKNIDPTYQPGRSIGQLFGNMVLAAMKRHQMQQAGLDSEDVHEVGPEYDNEYRNEPRLDGPYERPGNDNVPKTDDLGYNDRYDSRGYPYPIRGADDNGSDNTYRDSTSDLRFGVDDRYQRDPDFVTNPNGTPNRVSQTGYESGIDDNVPLEPLIPPRRDEIPEDADVYEGELNYDNESGKLKSLTVKTFTFQAQPIKPESEQNISMITVYYMD